MKSLTIDSGLIPDSPEGKQSAHLREAAISARLDRLPVCRYIWGLVALISFGTFFEVYELYQTAYIAPGLVRSGIFKAAEGGLFGLSDQASFAAANFAGLFIGTMFCSFASDRFGRRRIFVLSLLWYTATSIIMAFQHTNVAVDLWRFIGGIGVGVQIVTGNAYISELVPKSIRTKAFAFGAFIYHLAIPVLALVSWLLIPRDPLGLAGWRWVPLLGAVGALAIWWIRRKIPESPRWLAQVGRYEEAERVVSSIEARIIAEMGRALPPPSTDVPPPRKHYGFRELWKPPFRSRMIMLSIFSFCQSIGAYGFSNWLPTYLESRGAGLKHSLMYSFIIAMAYPVGGLILTRFANWFEAKWQVVVGAVGIAIFGLLFSIQTTAVLLITFGILITFSTCLLGYAFHAYQTELFPTGIRARAVGFCYSWSRLSVVFNSFMIAFFLGHFGSVGAFGFIAFAMLVVVFSISVFGPKTKGLALEEIAQ